MIAVTFDVDDVAWTSGRRFDEFSDAVPQILDELAAAGSVRTTWFVRVDAGIEASRGTPDALLTRYDSVVRRITTAGHEIGWHHHAVIPGSEAQPSSDVAFTCSELRRLAPLVRARGITSVRLGWAVSHPDIVACLDESGFRVDSSALPRPSYPWDAVTRDWSDTPHEPYRPSRADHRVPGEPSYAIVEAPMSVAALPLETDTQSGVQRYLNLAYHPAHFCRALAELEQARVLVTVTHPYELAGGASHPLLAFGMGALRENLGALLALARPFVTISELEHQC